jgi:dihydrofolate reductase
LEWDTSHALAGDAAEQVRRFKATAGPDLHLWGSSQLLQALTTADLVDEFRLWIYPMILGSGKRLFEAGLPPRAVTLVGSRRGSTDALLNTYRSAGPLPSQPDQPDNPAPAERARRHKWAQEEGSC